MKPLGDRGEDMAVRYLRGKGYGILRRNYTAPVGEIDIVARDGQTVVFVEVKARRDGRFGLPAEAVGYRKRQKLRAVALHYLAGLKAQPPARFDIVGIVVGEGGESIEHIEDAFEIS